jgi:Domain of unknown function (DUF4278)
MQLKFRDSSYEIPAPIQPRCDSIDQPKIKLIYRGHTYYATPRPVVVSQGAETAEPTTTLIYRGNTYEYQSRPLKLYQKPRAINWRYQIASD